MSDQLSTDTIQCPVCKSFAWVCFNETTKNCYDSHGDYVGLQVVGSLRCEDCKHVWDDYSVDDCADCEDCECDQ